VCHVPNSPWAGIIKLFSIPARESLVSDIPPGDGKIANLFLQCIIHHVIQYHERVKLSNLGDVGHPLERESDGQEQLAVAVAAAASPVVLVAQPALLAPAESAAVGQQQCPVGGGLLLPAWLSIRNWNSG
jgi:hypothetical protein